MELEEDVNGSKGEYRRTFCLIYGGKRRICIHFPDGRASWGGEENMIVIDRKTGELISADELSEAEKQQAAFMVFCAFCESHPEIIQEAITECLNETAK